MSARPEVPLASDATFERDASPVAALDPAESEYLAARRLFLEPERVRQSGLLLLGTMVLFALTAKLGQQGWQGVVVLVGVLLFHELGHWSGMKLFGFQDVRMFFIPFFGAAVSGRNVGAVAWKEALVLLMGPLPGLVVGTFLLIRSVFEPSHLVANVGLMMLLLNAFNLLPISPLDGGKFFQLLIFSRNRFLELAFTTFAGLAMLGLAVLLEAWVLGIVAGMMLLSIPRQWKLLRTVKELRISNPQVDRESAALDEPSLRTLYDAARAFVPKGVKESQRIEHHVQAMRQVHQRLRMHPPSVLASLGLCIIWFVGVAALLVGVLALGSGRTPRAPEWAKYQDAKAGFSILMPVGQPVRSSVVYGPASGSKVEGATLRAPLWTEHDYSVTTWKLEPPPATDAEREQLLEEIRSALVAQVWSKRTPPALDAPRELAGIAGRHLVFSGESAVSRGAVREDYWFGIREGRAFILRAEYDSRLATPDEAERFLTSFRPLP